MANNALIDSAETTSPVEDLRDFIRTLRDHKAEATQNAVAYTEPVLDFKAYPLEKFIDAFGEYCWMILLVTGILITGVAFFV